MRVLVTGGSGFLGGSVIPLLADNNHEVVALARSAKAAKRVTALGAKAIGGDLDDAASTYAAFQAAQADALCNLASLGFGHAPTIVAAAEESGIRRTVFVSTTAIFTKLDARSKMVRTAAEATVRESALDWTIVRPTMIYGGPGDRNMARLLKLLKWSPVVPLPGGGRKLQQPVHVDDLAHGVVAALGRPGSIGKAYDLAGPEPLTLRQIIDQAAAATGRRAKVVAVPLEPAIKALRIYERVAQTPRIKAEQLERLAEDKAFDISDARKDLEYEPRSFAEGIRAEAAILR